MFFAVSREDFHGGAGRGEGGGTEKRDKRSREKSSSSNTIFSRIEGKQCCLVDEATSGETNVS